jgi:hypothetical protein
MRLKELKLCYMLEDNLLEYIPWLVGIDNARVMVKR